MHVGLHTRLKPGAEQRYEEAHANYIECDDYGRAIAELAAPPVNRRWQAEMAPMLEVAHDYSGAADDKLRLIFQL